MVNQQLADYVKQQLQGGVQKDAVKKALLDAGWPAADVDDSLNAAAPAGAAAQTFNPAAVMGGGKTAAPAEAAGKGAAFFSASSPKTAEAAKSKSGGHTALYIMGFVILILLGALGYLYWTTMNRAPATGGVDAQALTAQVAGLNADKSNLSAELTQLTAANQGLLGEFSFFATTTSSSTVTGILGGSASAYIITTPHGIVVSLKYAKTAKVPDVKSLVGQEVQATGVRQAGTLELWAATVSAVNPPPAPPAPAATSTATTTTAGTAPAAATSTGTAAPPAPPASTTTAP